MYNRTKYLCRQLHLFLLESYLEFMSEDQQFNIKVCELDCEDCTSISDKIIEGE
jgi:hypothetical protein